MATDPGALDAEVADRLLAECSSGDKEGNGCQADRILCETLRRLGLARAADVYENLDLWRA
jgi:hypothetical protein